MESFVLQLLHFPPCIRKLITGISSYHFKTFPQLMQWERSKTISSFLGILYIHTFKKLPMVIPKRNTMRNKIRLIIVLINHNVFSKFFTAFRFSCYCTCNFIGINFNYNFTTFIGFGCKSIPLNLCCYIFICYFLHRRNKFG